MAVVAKRTYDIVQGGRVQVASIQVPLNADYVVDSRMDRSASVPMKEPDLWPIKLATDVVVLGKVHAPGARPTRHLRAAIAVGRWSKELQVFGDRSIGVAGGELRFTAPEPFTEMDLTYFRAYGGVDPSEPVPDIDPDSISDLDLAALLSDLLTPEKILGSSYPRNPAGVGYIVHPNSASIDGALLPNFEDPSNLLTLEHFRPRTPADWWRMPMPQGFGWFGNDWYPRCTYFGQVPPYPPPDDTEAVEEVRRGMIPRGWSRQVSAAATEKLLDWRLANGASPGLILPLEGHEPIVLTGMSRDGDIHFQLPGERPVISVLYRRSPLDVRRNLHTVLIEPEVGRLSLVWGALAHLPVYLPERLPSPDAHDLDPLEDIDVQVDGVPWIHEQTSLR